MTLAWPLASVTAEAALSVALAPDAWRAEADGRPRERRVDESSVNSATRGCEGLADHGSGAPRDDGQGVALALEGADVGVEVGRDAPRWSVVMPLTAVPAPMAALPGRRAMVWVGPP